MPANEQEIYGLRYSEFVVPLVKSVQELNALVTAQQKEIENQKNFIVQQNQEIVGYKEAMVMLTKRMNAVEAKVDKSNKNTYRPLARK